MWIPKVSWTHPLAKMRGSYPDTDSSPPLLYETRKHDGDRLGAQHHNGSFRECLNDPGSSRLAHTRSKFGEAVGESLLANQGVLRRRRNIVRSDRASLDDPDEDQQHAPVPDGSAHQAL
jgi:hypothetical protein